jgi:APA family basic amino acid/polyamine antiporter
MSQKDPARTVGLLGATTVGLGAIVGGGVIVLAGAALGATGPSAILAFALNGAIAFLTAFSFAEMSSVFPESGGAYAFAKKVLSVRAAFAVGWILWFAYIVAGVLYALGFSTYALAAVAGVLGQDAPSWIGSRQTSAAVAILAIVGYSWSLLRSTTGGGEWATWGKVVVFGVLILGGLWALRNEPEGSIGDHMSPFFSGGGLGLLQAMGFTFIALQGFDLIAAIGGEVKDPARVIPRAMMLSLGASLIIYLPLLLVVSTAGVPDGTTITELGRDSPDTVLAIAAREYLGEFGYWLVVIAAVLSTLSALQANILAASRVALSMAKDRTLPVVLSHLHAARQTPVMAIYATSLALVAILLMIPNVSAAGAAASLIFLISFALAHLTAILARLRRAEPPPFRSPWFPAIPLVGGVACSVLAVFQGMAVPSAGLITLFWLGLGVLLYIGLFSARATAFDAFAEAQNPDLLRLRGRSPLILVPMANPDSAAALVGVAGALHPPGAGRVLLLTVMAPPSETAEGRTFESLRAAQNTLDQALRASMGAGHTPETLMTIARSPWEEISRVASDHGCEGLLLGRSDLTGVPGGPLEDLMNRVACDVAFLRAPPGWRLDATRRILVVVGGRGAHRAMRARLLGSLCRAAPREVTWIRVLTKAANAARVTEARRELAAIAADETPGGATVTIVQSDDIAETVAEHAKTADLVVAGLERTPSGRRAFGTLVPEIVKRTGCASILISRH